MPPTALLVEDEVVVVGVVMAKVVAATARVVEEPAPFSNKSISCLSNLNSLFAPHNKQTKIKIRLRK